MSLRDGLTWVAATAIAMAGATAWAFQVFETQKAHDQTYEQIMNRLDRIEAKIDQFKGEK